MCYYFQTITLEDVEDYMMTAALHPAQVSRFRLFTQELLLDIQTIDKPKIDLLDKT